MAALVVATTLCLLYAFKQYLLRGVPIEMCVWLSKLTQASNLTLKVTESAVRIKGKSDWSCTAKENIFPKSYRWSVIATNYILQSAC